MHLDSFIGSAVVLLSVAVVAVALFKQLGLGSVLGLLVAGIVVGPHFPGPHVTQHVDDLRHFTELGVVMLLFLIGLELRPRRLWSMRREMFGLGSLQILLTGVAIAGYVKWFRPDWASALLIGLTLALSSTAFVLQLLQERGEVASAHGQTAFAVLLMQDLAIVPLLALVPLIGPASNPTHAVGGPWVWLKILAMLGLLWLVGRYALPFAFERLIRGGNREGLVLMTLLAVLLSAWTMAQAGISMALGAFLMGVLLSSSRYHYQIQANIEPYKGLLMSLFFIAVGMSIDFSALALQPGLFLLHTTVIIAIKLIVLFGLASAFGYSRARAWRLSCWLAQSGEFGFVLFGSARALGVIDEATFVLGLGVISLSMLTMPLLVRVGDAVARRWDRDEWIARNTLDQKEPLPAPRGRVIIGGYGRVGHTVATLLHASGIRVIAFDQDPDRVAKGKADGLPVFYGDISDPQLLGAIHLAEAALVVLTIDDQASATRAVTHIRQLSPSVPVIARAGDLRTAGDLMTAGVDYAYPEAIESSLRLAGLTLQMVGVAGEDVDALLQGVRDQGYAPVLPKKEDNGVKG